LRKTQRRDALQPGHGRGRLLADRDGPMRTNGIPPIRFHHAPSLPARSAFMARSIPAMAEIPIASRCRDAWAQTDEGRHLEGQFLRHQEFAQPLEQFLPIFLSDPPQQRSISPSTTTGVLGGINGSHTFKGQFCRLADGDRNRRAKPDMDDIRLDLNNSVQRQFPVTHSQRYLTRGKRRSVSRRTRCTGPTGCETNVGLARRFLPKPRSIPVFTPANSGSANAFIGSPKFGVVFGPFAKTEFFINAR